MSKDQSGYALLMTLIFLFVITLIVMSQSNSVIMSIKSFEAMQQYQQLYSRASVGILEFEREMLGKRYSLHRSDIALHVSIEHQVIDDCGNQRIDIKSIASLHQRKLILRARDIFASVAVAKGCMQLPRFQRIWWREG